MNEVVFRQDMTEIFEHQTSCLLNS